MTSAAPGPPTHAGDRRRIASRGHPDLTGGSHERSRVSWRLAHRGVNEPVSRATQVTIHQPAWYNLGEGAYAAGVTNDSLFEWSLRPIAGERVHLVGDAWRPDLSGWSDGAYKGSVYVLNRFFGTNIDPKEPSRIKCNGGDIIDPD